MGGGGFEGRAYDLRHHATITASSIIALEHWTSSTHTYSVALDGDEINLHSPVDVLLIYVRSVHNVVCYGLVCDVICVADTEGLVP